METLSFESAIEQTQALLNSIETLAPQSIEQLIATLVASETGARGFFVIYLTSNFPAADASTAAVIAALKTSPDIVSELLVKNLAMSTAMALFHRRNADIEAAADSDRVRQRTVSLMQQLPSASLTAKLQQLRETILTGRGDYRSFLDRWGYDSEQQQAIATAIRP